MSQTCDACGIKGVLEIVVSTSHRTKLWPCIFGGGKIDLPLKPIYAQIHLSELLSRVQNPRKLDVGSNRLLLLLLLLD